MAWTRTSAARLGGDAGRLYLMGFSAGAHTAALLAIDSRYLAAHGAHMPLQPGVETPPGIRNAREIHAMEADYRAIADVLERIQPWLRDWVGL